MRKIPVTMATQHPDNAGPSPFTGERFVPASAEIDECYRCFSELGVDEYMWDWEGKFVDEAVIDRLYQNYTEYFRKHQLGKDKFLTFRIPNMWEQKTHRVPRSLMNICAAENAARNYKFHSPPIFEVILPMATSAEQLLYVDHAFTKVADAMGDIFDMPTPHRHLDVIPLFEDIETMGRAPQILAEYVDGLKKTRKGVPKQMRVFIARSDPAMNSGLIPTVLAVKLLIADTHGFGTRSGIAMYPWVGGGSLPFRGGINPENVDAVIEEYAGAHSLTIQSAFRSDYPLGSAKKAIARINKELPRTRNSYLKLEPAEIKAIRRFGRTVEQMYQKTVEPLAPFINEIARYIPRRRERVQHIGLFGYSRGIGKVKLPRAISFTGALYSLGIPPEFIATGRALKEAKKQGVLPLMLRMYPNLKRDLLHAGKYLNTENLRLLAGKHREFKPVVSDITEIEAYLGEELKPTKSSHFLHRNHTSNVYYQWRDGDDYAESILNAAEVRKSIG